MSQEKPSQPGIRNPLAEVFGFPIDNFSAEAALHRANRLCPYNNGVRNCTKSTVDNPIGVCSMRTNEGTVITCPVRFRQEWSIAKHAASFFFPTGTRWERLSEVTVTDRHGKEAGGLDLVLVALDDRGNILDFGGVEVQSVYISGTISGAFRAYMEDPAGQSNLDWRKSKNYPRPDYLSSTRKRLAPQLLYKGRILKSWNKKSAVVVQEQLFQTLPALPVADKEKADIAWLIYDLIYDKTLERYALTHTRTVYTLFSNSLEAITTPVTGSVDSFLRTLTERLKKPAIVRDTNDMMAIRSTSELEGED